eukprot:gene11919-5324_t
MKRKELMSETESSKPKKSYFGDSHEIREQEMVEFSKKALEIQKRRKEHFDEDTPQIAVKRMKEFEILKENFEYYCDKYNIKTIPCAVERWCLTEKLLEDSGDPLIPNPESDINSALYHELLNRKCSREDAKEICSKLAKESRKSFEILKKYNKNEKKYQKIQIITLNSKMKIKYHQIEYYLNFEHFEKLKSLYYDKEKDNEKEFFETRLFCLLARYNTLGAPGYQGAIPKNLFNWLNENLELKSECFASPLNCTIKNSYHSGFYDVDRFFGSKGSFFWIDELNGSFESNPPFIEEIMYMMSLHIIDLLKNSKKLSFFIVLPGWDDCEHFNLLNNSEFKKLFLKFKKREHNYLDGSQHQSSKQIRLSEADSFVFLLQNEGFNKLTDENIEEIKKNFSK